MNIPVGYKRILVAIVAILLSACSERELKSLYLAPHALDISSDVMEFSDQTGAKTTAIALEEVPAAQFIPGVADPRKPYLLTFLTPRWQHDVKTSRNLTAELYIVKAGGGYMRHWVLAFNERVKDQSGWGQGAALSKHRYVPVSDPDPVKELNAERGDDCAENAKRVSVDILGQSRWLVRIVCGQISAKYMRKGDPPFGFYEVVYFEISNKVAISFSHTITGPVFDPDDQTQLPGSPEQRQQIAETLSQTKLTPIDNFDPVERAKHQMLTGQLTKPEADGPDTRAHPNYPKSFRTVDLKIKSEYARQPIYFFGTF